MTLGPTMRELSYSENPYAYRRRKTRQVKVDNIGVGGDNPIRVQSMITCDTMDTDASIQQTIELANVGCEIVRITAPTVKDARNLEHIVKGLRERACNVPIVADIHFKPEAAMEAAKWVDKVRINPGNYADSKKFVIREYTDEQYAGELNRIRERFSPLVDLCKKRSIAMRIGTNHGSLSDRILNRYGDTIRVSLTEDSPHEIPVARALIENIERTSGSQLSTLNPQLSFDPYSYQRRASDTLAIAGIGNSGQRIKLGGAELIRVVVKKANFDKIAHKIEKMGDYKPEIIYGNAGIVEIDPRDETAIAKLNAERSPQFVTVRDDVDLAVIPAFRLLAGKLHSRHPILLKDVLSRGEEMLDTGYSMLDKEIQHPVSSIQHHPDFLTRLLSASTNIGSLLCDGIGDAILVQGEEAPGQALRLSYNVLQAAGSRIFKTDYVACPSCGRTLFNLQTTTAKIKETTSHLKGVKIAIMGCIVNGPGEMADADFGYVGGAPGKVNLYVGKTAVKFNIPEAEAVDRLKDLIREHGKWMEPATQPALAEANI